jgi:hypothetical protein
MLNQQFTTAANVRVAVLAGVAAYLAYSAAAVVGPYVRAEVSSGAQFVQAGPVGLPLLAWGPILATVGLVWLTGSRVVVLAGALPSAAAVCVADSWHRYALGAPVVALASLAAMVALSGHGKPPNRRWLALIGFFATLPIVAEVEPPAGPYVFEVLLLPAGAVGIVWAVVDARPAIAMSVFLVNCGTRHLVAAPPVGASGPTVSDVMMDVKLVLPYIGALDQQRSWRRLRLDARARFGQLNSRRIASLTAAMCRAPAARDTRRAVR